MNLSLLKLTYTNIKILLLAKEYKKEYKKRGKNFLEKKENLTNWNLEKLLHLIPFIFGFSNMIWSRYQDQKISFFFGENLPGIKPDINEEIYWETFKFLKYKSIALTQLNNIDIYPNYSIFQIKKGNKKKIIGILFPLSENKLSKNLGFSKQSKIFLDSDIFEKNIFIKMEDVFYCLDEIPEKVEDITISSLKNNKKITNSIFTSESTNTIKNEQKIKKQKIFVPKSFLVGQKNKAHVFSLKVVISENFKEKVKKNILLNTKNKKIKENKKNLLKNKLNFFFYEKGIEPKSKIPDSIRKLSGFFYPDLSRKLIYKKKLNSIFRNNPPYSFLKIQLPTNFIACLKDNSLIPSTSYNSCPITWRREKFCGLTNEDLLFSTTNQRMDTFISKETIKRAVPSLEDFENSDPDYWFFFFKLKNKSKAINLENSFFKDYLKTIFINKSLYSNKILCNTKNVSFLFYPFAENFLIEKNSITFNFGETYKKTSTLITLLNKKSFLFKTTNVNFFEPWEPISLNSWMIVTQLSIGLFLLHLLKDLYKDYGKELVEYVLQLASGSGIDIEELKEQYLYEDLGYRLIKNSRKSFKDIVGIEKILLQLGEIVWFLRNNGRSAKLKKSIPNGILLTGPPGTGKTLLVQAIAGEAQIPIITESASLLNDPQQKNRSVEKLKKIFDQARELAPCIIFIDEVDTLGEKRQNIIQTPMGSDDLIESIYEKTSNQKEEEFIPKPLNIKKIRGSEKDFEYQIFRDEKESQEKSELELSKQITETKKTRLNLLTQFLIEMDGLKKRQSVIVIGATNRPNVLDPALIRPGRFDQIINLELPGKQKRIEILKLYGKKIPFETNISWEFLAKKTVGFSAADLATAMNESIIQSIITKTTTHTVESIEKGINFITSYHNDFNLIDIKTKKLDPFFLSRLAYYQAGKALVPLVLKNHPPQIVLHLFPRQKNARYSRLYDKSFFKQSTKERVEAQIIGLYVGKASEIIPLYGNKISHSLKRWDSDIGSEDLISATLLANLLVEKWYFYSLQVLIRKQNKLLKNRNENEYNDIEKLSLTKNLNCEIEDELEIENIAKISRLGKYQQRAFGAWWQIQAAKETSEKDSIFADWYRIYLPDPEENNLNLEWIPPDEYHHSNNYLKKVSEKSNISFTDLYSIERDYIFHGLLLNSFNKAFNLIEEKREFLDFFSDYLLRFQYLKENENLIILNKQNIESKQKGISTRITDPIKKVEKFWGENSRRKNLRFVNIETVLAVKKNFNYMSPFFKEKKE